MITTAQIMGRVAGSAEMSDGCVYATPVPIEFTYDTGDPWAVRAVFGTRVVWLFALELLADGLRWPVGEGDVRLWPSERCLMMHLNTPAAQALIALPLGEVARFVDQAEQLAAQMPEVSLDHELARLLDGA